MAAELLDPACPSHAGGQCSPITATIPPKPNMMDSSSPWLPLTKLLGWKMEGEASTSGKGKQLLQAHRDEPSDYKPT